MLEISDGFTSISAGSDRIENCALEASREKAPTGARVTLEFRRERALAPAQWVRVRYDFAGNGTQRVGTGIAQQTQTIVRCGQAVVYHYRLSYWITQAALMDFVLGNVRYRTEECEIPPQPSGQQALVVA